MQSLPLSQPLSRRLDGRVSAGSGPDPGAPVISIVGGGVPFPGKTFATTRPDLPWLAGGVQVAAGGATYVPPVQLAGAKISQSGGNEIQLWSPSDSPIVAEWRWCYGGMLHTVGPDAEAVAGQTVRSWVGQKNGWFANQTTVNAQPILRLASGVPYLEFDGDYDRVVGTSEKSSLPGTMVLGHVVASVHDLSPTDATLVALTYGMNVKHTLRRTASGRLGTHQRRVENGTISQNNSPGTYQAGDCVHTAISDYTPGTSQSFTRENAVQVQLYSNPDSGAQPDETELVIDYVIGGRNSEGREVARMNATFAAVLASDAISLVELSRLERFAMLTMGSLYTGPDIPLVEA